MMNTTIKRISAVAGLAALVIVALWYFALFSPQAKDLSKAHKDHAAAEQKISQLQGQVVQLNALKSQIPADKAALSVLNAAVPSSPQLDNVLRQLHAAATASGITLSTVGPSSPTAASTSTASKTSGTPSITLALSASGTYSQITAFLSQLARMPRTVVVSSLNIAGSGTQLTAQITANIFYTGA
jgi:Tfp pilus assembly protein PilO